MIFVLLIVKLFFPTKISKSNKSFLFTYMKYSVKAYSLSLIIGLGPWTDFLSIFRYQSYRLGFSIDSFSKFSLSTLLSKIGYLRLDFISSGSERSP